MVKRKTVEVEINEFLDYWNRDHMIEFLRLAEPLVKMFDVDDTDDWVRDEVGENDAHNIRLIRTVYLVSRIADFHAGRFVNIKIQFKDLWRRMEALDIAIEDAAP